MANIETSGSLHAALQNMLQRAVDYPQELMEFRCRLEKLDLPRGCLIEVNKEGTLQDYDRWAEVYRVGILKTYGGGVDALVQGVVVEYNLDKVGESLEISLDLNFPGDFMYLSLHSLFRAVVYAYRAATWGSSTKPIVLLSGSFSEVGSTRVAREIVELEDWVTAGEFKDGQWTWIYSHR